METGCQSFGQELSDIYNKEEPHSSCCTADFGEIMVHILVMAREETAPHAYRLKEAGVNLRSLSAEAKRISWRKIFILTEPCEV